MRYEDEIVEKGLTAPRVTPERIEEVIDSIEYLYSGVNTICLITLVNGWIVKGFSACVSEANYNKSLGENIARDNAKNEIWSLEGYLLKNRLYEARELDDATI